MISYSGQKKKQTGPTNLQIKTVQYVYLSIISNEREKELVNLQKDNPHNIAIPLRIKNK